MSAGAGVPAITRTTSALPEPRSSALLPKAPEGVLFLLSVFSSTIQPKENVSWLLPTSLVDPLLPCQGLQWVFHPLGVLPYCSAPPRAKGFLMTRKTLPLARQRNLGIIEDPDLKVEE